MGRIVNQEEHINTPLEELINMPTVDSEQDKVDRAKALGQIKKN
ncbi:hypothetical protein FPFC_011680 [Fructobacillus pseudoficulneus]|uniref:Uncharacterized protein n=1 Tax=Fructobacillus pseudoficulneus TaxID=220714 RepID=A0A3F3H0V9_9LACO|nr:hypothetical protein [Fructobacillus pseudoficulneus]GAP02288.1 hypothetical protein FPFC_011680 [Fructobacillus pseudoficulneus]SEH36290.1 hypothetical protein SAMN05660469_0240 [Fructobacillus pseudoficulneus]